MHKFTRRVIGFGIHRGIVDGSALCRMFQRAMQRQSLPKYLSTDNDPGGPASPISFASCRLTIPKNLWVAN
jgi:hypothetical protein